MIYFSPIISNIPEHLRHKFGYMVGLVSRPQDRHLGSYLWMLDNGAFTGKFQFDKWMTKLEQLETYSSTCVGVIVPDVVGDKDVTLEWWYHYAYFPASIGYKVAFAAQDGMAVEDVPWDELDMLFIGGSKEWKYHDSWDLIREGLARGVWVHIGRVNSQKSIRFFACADSADGTQLIYTPQYYRQILRTTEEVRGRKMAIPLFENEAI